MFLSDILESSTTLLSSFTDMSLLETKAAATREYMNKGQSKAKNPTEGEKKKNGDSAYQTEETVGYESTMDSFQL